MARIKYLVLIGLALFSLALVNKAEAQIIINNITTGIPGNGQVKITWNTSQPAKTDIYFGLSSDNLDKHLGNIEYKTGHQADLTGLKKKTDYYYKIVAVNESGQRTESFVQYFNTKDMKDTTIPQVSGLRVVQTTDTAAAIYFLTDEPTRINLDYGLDSTSLDRHWSNHDLRYDHLIILTGLTAGNKYNFRLLAKDEDANTTERSGDFKTDSYHNYEQIKISNLVPESRNQAPALTERAAISWDSNIMATSEINYGTDPNNLWQSIRASTNHQLSHRVELPNLQANTVYYFKIKMWSELNRKNFESQVYSLKTAPMTLDYLRQFFQSGNILEYQREYYYLYNNSRIKLNNNSLNGRGYKQEAAKSIEDKYFKQYNESWAYWGAYHDGQAVKSANSNTVYVIDGQYKRPIANWSVFKYLNYSSADIVIDHDGNLRNYRDGQLVKHSKELTGQCPIKNYTLAKSPNGGTVYLIVNNRKMPIVNQQVFLRYGFKFSAVKTVSWGILSQIIDGQVII
jgi:hypothetical protein